MKRYFFNLTMNTRDLGGYKTKDGKETKYLRFIRSDTFNFINEEDKKFLLDNNFRLSLDFRTEIVIKNHPSQLELDGRFEYHNIPFIEGSQITLTKENASDLYMMMVNRFENFKGIFTYIAETPYNVVYNCTAGKDRTGVLSALLLMLVQVDEQDIIHDYEVSETFINEGIDKIRALHPGFPETMGFSKRETMEEFLQKFKNKYGSVENYLHLLGIDDKQIDSIKNKLIGD